jgi:hypothetical protein
MVGTVERLRDNWSRRTWQVPALIPELEPTSTPMALQGGDQSRLVFSIPFFFGQQRRVRDTEQLWNDPDLSRGTRSLQTPRWSKGDSNLYGAFSVK